MKPSSLRFRVFCAIRDGKAHDVLTVAKCLRESRDRAADTIKALVVSGHLERRKESVGKLHATYRATIGSEVARDGRGRHPASNAAARRKRKRPQVDAPAPPSAPRHECWPLLEQCWPMPVAWPTAFRVL